MPPVKEKAVKFVNFESPLVGFHLNTWEFNKALESYNNIMLNFHGNIRGNGAAIKEISNLYSNKIGRKSYIDIMAKPFLDALGIDSTIRPSVKEMMDIANNINIVEPDGKVVTYAEKYFNNSTIDVLLDNEKSGKYYGSLLAVHMGSFLSMKSMNEMDSYKTAFLANKITPGVSRADQPPRVFITMPNEAPIAVVGSNFINTEKDLDHPQVTLNNIDRELLGYDNKIFDWNKEAMSLLATADRNEKKYNEKLKELEDKVKLQETAYDTWKKDRNIVSDNTIREEYKASERAKLEEKYKKWEEEVNNTYEDEFNERRKRVTSNQEAIDRKTNNEPLIPDPPVETNIFRKIWVALGGGHSKRYKDSENIRNQRMNDHQIWESELDHLKKNQISYKNSVDELTKQIEDMKREEHAKIEMDVEKIPSGAELRAKEDADRKKIIEDAKKAVSDHIKVEKPKMEKNVADLKKYAKQYKDKVVAAERIKDEKKNRQETIFGAISDIDKAKATFNTFKSNYKKASEAILKQIVKPPVQEKKELDADSINRLLRNPEVKDKFLDDPEIGTLGKNATYKMMEMINHKTMSKAPEETEFALAHSIIGCLDSEKANELGEKVKKHQKVSFSSSSKPYAYRIGQEAYKKMQDNAAKKFKEVFGVECTPTNVEKVSNAIGLDKAVNYRITVVESNEDEYSLPLITEKNYKDVNLLLITGIKTAMGLDPLKKDNTKKDNTKKAESVNVKEQAIVVRKATKPAGMNM